MHDAMLRVMLKVVVLLLLQVSQAFGSVTNLGGMALHQGLLDYTAQVGGNSTSCLSFLSHTWLTEHVGRHRLASGGFCHTHSTASACTNTRPSV